MTLPFTPKCFETDLKPLFSSFSKSNNYLFLYYKYESKTVYFHALPEVLTLLQGFLLGVAVFEIILNNVPILSNITAIVMTKNNFQNSY
jgi:uncharacterized membrane protein